MAFPPSEDGAVQLKEIWVLPDTAFTPVGAPGTVAGMAETSAEDELSPLLFTAITM